MNYLLTCSNNVLHNSSVWRSWRFCGQVQGGCQQSGSLQDLYEHARETLLCLPPKNSWWNFCVMSWTFQWQWYTALHVNHRGSVHNLCADQFYFKIAGKSKLLFINCKDRQALWFSRATWSWKDDCDICKSIWQPTCLLISLWMRKASGTASDHIEPQAHWWLC